MTAVLLTVAATAFLTSLIGAWLAMRAGVLDLPNARSSHTKPTPRAGGLGIVAGLGAAGIGASLSPLGGAGLAGVLLVTGLFALLGFLDDLVVLPTRLKFAAFVALCLAMVAATAPVLWLGVAPAAGVSLPLWAGWIGTGLFVFVVANATNFMDGSDGMLAAVMIPASLGLAVAGLVAGVTEASLIGVGLAASLAGFAVFNRPPAGVFAGDVGALAVGAAYAGGGLLLAANSFAGALWIAPLFALPFLGDVLLTLLRRARHGRFTLAAHREHAYQRLILSGWGHGQVAGLYAGLTSLIVLTGLIAIQAPDGVLFVVFCGWVALITALYVWAGRRAGD